MRDRYAVRAAFTLLLVIVSSAPRAQAITSFGGYGQASLQIAVQDRNLACSVSLSARLALTDPGFVLSQTAGPGTGSAADCLYEGIVQGTLIASDQSPPAHRCFVAGQGGGAGVSASPYTLSVADATFTISRVDFVACSSREIISDKISLTTSSSAVAYSRELVLGTPGYPPRYLLRMQAQLARAVSV